MENEILKLANGTVLWDSDRRGVVSDRINNKGHVSEEGGSGISNWASMEGQLGKKG